MHVFDAPGLVRAWSDRMHRDGRTVGLVPTMGALHAGHAALIDEARRRCDDVVVSIFVNPLQFNAPSDFDSYPRPVDDDLAACGRAGVSAVYAPTTAAMYPPGFQTHVEPGQLADRFDGEHRPGHFRGVTTVVSKLFAAVLPEVAFFGQKDAQQLAIIRRMNLDLDHGVRIVAMPTIREHDGLALSSRNRRLTAADRAAAVCIWHALQSATSLVSAGERSAAMIEAAVVAAVAAEPSARLEYAAVVHPDSFELIQSVGSEALILVAAWFGDVRLIDNIVVSA